MKPTSSARAGSTAKEPMSAWPVVNAMNHFRAAYANIADQTPSATTIRTRREEWITGGVFAALEGAHGDGPGRPAPFIKHPSLSRGQAKRVNASIDQRLVEGVCWIGGSHEVASELQVDEANQGGQFGHHGSQSGRVCVGNLR